MKLSPPRLILGMAVIAGLAAEAWQWSQHHQRPPPAVAVVGQVAPNLSLLDLQAQPHSLQSYRGRRVLLNFWASWCLPCQTELPALDQLANQSELQVIGVAMDQPAAVRAYLQRHPLHYPVLLGQLTPPSSSARFDDAGGLLPYSVLIDTDGRVIARQLGPLSPAQLQRWAQPSSPH